MAAPVPIYSRDRAEYDWGQARRLRKIKEKDKNARPPPVATGEWVWYNTFLKLQSVDKEKRHADP